MGGGAAITWALPDVMLKQWRAVWTALGGLWVAISAGRRAPAGRTSKLTLAFHLTAVRSRAVHT